MSDHRVLIAGDPLSRKTVQDHGPRDPVLHALPVRRIEGVRVTALNPGRSGDNRPSKSSAPKRIDPEQILRSFNTWSFKREQPSDPQLMLRIIADAVAQHQPIPFVLYWGKGPRCGLDDPDVKCLDYLTAFTHRVSAVYEPGASMKLIFTDTHARLNGYSETAIHAYCSAIEIQARQRGFDRCWLGELIETTHAQAEDYVFDEIVPPDMLTTLSASAMKWYGGDGPAEQGAKKYFHMNMVEKRAVELSFPDAIFLTFNSSKFRILFPKRMPIFYMYSLQRGIGVKPWFLPTEAEPCDESTCKCRPPNPQNR
jgi:L-tyrosine isonitrile synthase